MRTYFLLGRSLLAIAVLLGTLVPQGETLAAQSDLAEAEDSRAGAIDEIIVTSRRREESLQEVPVSVTAFTSSELQEINVTEASGVANLTPNLMINPTASGSTAFVTCMRGLCRTDTTITDDPYVGIYVNGVYTGKAIGSVFEVADIERVEVMRGPQGTLFGKNTLGGAVNLVTAKPSGKAGFRGGFLGGSYTSLNWKGVLDLPEAFGFSTKFSFLSKKHDAFTRNALGTSIDPTDLGTEDRQAVLLHLMWQPADNFYADFTFDWSQHGEIPFANFSTQNTGAFSFPDTPTFDERNPWTVSYDEAAVLASVGLKGGVSPSNDATAFGYALNLTWEIDEGTSSVLKSITSYRTYDNDYVVNSSGLSFRNLWTQDNFESQNISTELQYSGAVWDDRIEILAGFYYLREEGYYRNWQGNMADPATGATLGTFSDLITDTWVKYNSFAFYTEEVLHITDQVALTAGVRFTYEDREAEHAFMDINSDGFVPGAGTGTNPLLSWSTADGEDFAGRDTDTTFDSKTWSPRVVLSYQPIDEIMIFGGWSRGFKSGGFNARSVTAPTWNPYDDERADSFELGFKSTFWDGRALVNATGFYQMVDDPQIQFNRINFATGLFEVLLANSGEARIYGAEVESTVYPVDGLELRVGFGLTDSHYNDVTNPFPPFEDQSDERHLQFTPKYNWNITGRYELPPTPVGIVALRLDYTGSSNFGFNSAKSDDYIVGQGSYGLLNMRLSLSEIPLGDEEMGNLELAFVANNVTDNSYRVGGYGANLENLGVGRFYTNVYGPPRFLGGEIVYRWGSQM